MFVQLSVHRPRPGMERYLIESMHRYCEAARGQRGLGSVHTLKDEATGELFGLAIWESEESFLAARPALVKAVEGDDFDSWEEGSIEDHRLRPV